MIYNNKSIHARRAKRSWQNQSHYAKAGKIINQHVGLPNEHNNQACINDNDIKSSQWAIER